MLKKQHSFDGVRSVLSRLGNPHDKLKYIHITGTNGKGSVAHMCALALTGAGVKTGLFVSPHLVNVCERISVDGQNISEAVFADCLTRVTAAETEKLTFFELITCAAFLYFAEQNCGMVVLEAGIGGRLDVTNVIGRSEVAVITSVGLDHTELLGDTIEAIAAEKAGIIRPGGVCVCAEADASAVAVIREEARLKNSAFIYAPQAFPFRFSEFDWENGRTLFSLPDGSVRAVAALGRHYVANAATVCAVLDVMRRTVPALTPDSVYSSFLRFNWPARFQVSRGAGGKTVILDGAHNPQAAATFADTFRSSPYLKTPDRVLVTAVMRDKDYRAVLAALLPLFDSFIATNTQSARALPAGELAAVIRELKPSASVAAEPDVNTALASGRTREVCVIAGSFYLAGCAL